jgi:solute carrier family 39 (zinc transporter), member 9
MLVVSFGVGTVPLQMNLSRARMAMVSSLGAGMLIGTSLGVVLPEGIFQLLQEGQEGGRQIKVEVQRAEHAVEDVMSPGTKTVEPHHHDLLHLSIAASLVSGYLLMYLLAFLPPLLLVKPPRGHAGIPLTSSSSPCLERSASPGIPSSSTPQAGLSHTTIGLCIHALADGVALAASLTSNNLTLQNLIFFAIILHKVLPPAYSTPNI